jgi:hypothetical protein
MAETPSLRSILVSVRTEDSLRERSSTLEGKGVDGKEAFIAASHSRYKDNAYTARRQAMDRQQPETGCPGARKKDDMTEEPSIVTYLFAWSVQPLFAKGYHLGFVLHFFSDRQEGFSADRAVMRCGQIQQGNRYNKAFLAKRAETLARFSSKAHEQAFPVIADRAEGALLEASGNQPVKVGVPDKAAGQIQDIFIFLYLHFTGGILVAQCDIAALERGKLQTGLFMPAFAKEVAHCFETVIFQHNSLPEFLEPSSLTALP